MAFDRPNLDTIRSQYPAQMARQTVPRVPLPETPPAPAIVGKETAKDGGDPEDTRTRSELIEAGKKLGLKGLTGLSRLEILGMVQMAEAKAADEPTSIEDGPMQPAPDGE